MNHFKIEAFFQEFPFLATLVEDPNKVEEVRVARIDENFLEKRLRCRKVTGSSWGIEESERAFLIDKAGETIMEIWHERSITNFVDNEECGELTIDSGGTVGDSLFWSDDLDVVAYIVYIRTGHTIRDHHSVGGYSVVVYKPPKKFTLKEWNKEHLRREEEKLELANEEYWRNP